MSLLGSANDSVNLVKAALDAKTALATAEEKEKLADAKLALADLKELIAELKENNQLLAQQLKERDDFVLDKSVRWLKSDSNQDQPFCPVCYAKGNIVPLQKTWEGRGKTQSIWNCPNKDCNATFNPWDHVENSSGVVESSPGFFSRNDMY
jgi:DNA-binding protein H-NS